MCIRDRRQHHQFAGGVARECDASRPGSHADDERHPCEGAFQTARQLQHGEGDIVVLPQHDVMFEEDRIVRAQVNFGHRNDLAFHLAGAGAELKLGHVAQARGFPPARFADQITDIQRRAARMTGERGLGVHALAPLALDPFERLGRTAQTTPPRAWSACGCLLYTSRCV